MVEIRGNELNPAPKTRIEIWLNNDTLEWFSRQGQAQGIENYHNLIEEALHEYIQYYPDLHKIEKESNSVLTNLADFIDEPEKQVPSKKQNFFEKNFVLLSWLYKTIWIEASFWEKCFLAVPFLIIISYAILFNIFFPKPSNLAILFLVFLTIISGLLYVLLNFSRTMPKNKKTETIIRENLEKIDKDLLREELEIEKLFCLYNTQKLRITKAKIIELIEDWEKNNEINNKLIPFLAFLIMIVPVGFYGIPVDLGNAVFYAISTAIVTIIIRPVLEFIGESAPRPIIRGFKKCLLLLEEAYIIAEKLEENKNNSQSQQTS